MANQGGAEGQHIYDAMLIAKYNGEGGAIKEVLNAKNSIDLCTVLRYSPQINKRISCEGQHFLYWQFTPHLFTPPPVIVLRRGLG